jgi:hypothetical protein
MTKLLDEIPEDDRSEAHRLAARIADDYGATDYAFESAGKHTTVHLLFEQDRDTQGVEAGATGGIHPETDDADGPDTEPAADTDGEGER